MRRRAGWILLAVVLVVVAGAVGLWQIADRGPIAALTDAEPVSVYDAEAGRLDTLRLRGRAVTATVDGTVVEIEDGGRLLLDVGDGTFPLRLSDADSLQVDDRLLVVGRVRRWGPQRWLDVSAWSRVVVSGR